jgi:hypothetical protein
MTDIKTPFRQQSFGNCGLYTLANLFNAEGYLAFCKPGHGHCTYELQRILEPYLDGAAYVADDYLLPLGAGRITDYKLLYRFEVDEQERTTGESLDEPGKCLLYLFTISNEANTILHVVGAVHEAKSGGKLWVVDSLQDTVWETSLKEFFETKWVTGIANFRAIDAGGPLKSVALWYLDRFAHLTGPLGLLPPVPPPGDCAGRDYTQGCQRLHCDCWHEAGCPLPQQASSATPASAAQSAR